MNQQSSGRQVVTLGNIILFLSQPFFALTLSAVCLAEKQQIPLLSTPTRDVYVNHHNTDVIYDKDSKVHTLCTV